MLIIYYLYKYFLIEKRDETFTILRVLKIYWKKRCYVPSPALCMMQKNNPVNETNSAFK